MDKTIACIAKDKCTGCGACYNICPQKAIDMIPDEEGFVFPVINEARCTNCGVCLRKCPLECYGSNNEPTPECYAVMGKDEIRMQSSSGGVFTILAEWVLQQGGVVCGAAYSDDCYHVEHILIEDQKDLPKLRGSKYVQSDIGTVYQEVKKKLEKDIPVLFTGTPCQVAAIKSYLGKDDPNLYTVDLVCHGVPSPAVYEQFIKELEEQQNSKIIRVSFRDKEPFEWSVSTSIDFADGTRYQKKRNESPYLQAFLSMLTLRKSCGQCPFAAIPRQGDLTMADFWGVHRHKASLDDRKGTSLVLPNNPKGKKLLQVIEDKAVVCEKAPLEIALKQNGNVKYSSKLHKQRDRFYSLLNEYHFSVEKAVKYALTEHYDIGFVGWWYGTNYGSALTNFALNRVLVGMGKTVLMLEWPNASAEMIKNNNSHSRQLARRYYRISKPRPLDGLDDLNKYCDTFVVGSDQLWNWWSNKDVGSYYYFLNFVDNKHKKIAYSTSFGHESGYYPEDMRLQIAHLLSRFDAVSVRETSGIDICRDMFQTEAVQTADPVFVCDVNEYIKMSQTSSADVSKPYLLAYILNPTNEKRESIKYISDKLGIPYKIILDGQEAFEKLSAEMDDENVLENVGVDDWVKYFANASYVLTDSFHGTCFSIIFERPMTVFPNKLRGLARFESLAELSGIGDRFVNSFSEVKEKEQWNKTIDFALVHKKMQPFVDYSKEWLKDALNRKKRQATSKELQLEAVLDAKRRLDTLEHQRQEKKSNPKKNNQIKEMLRRGKCCLEDNGYRYTFHLVVKKCKTAVANKFRKLTLLCHKRREKGRK